MTKSEIETTTNSLKLRFQPIITPKNANIFGVEVFLNNYNIDSNDIQNENKKQIYNYKNLFSKVISEFYNLPSYKDLKLFFPLDQIEVGNENNNFIKNITIHENILKFVYFQINRNSRRVNYDNINKMIDDIYEKKYTYGFSNFLNSFNSLENLYENDISFIKFDKQNIKNINKDIKSKTFTSHIISLCKVSGTITIATGIETLSDYYTAVEMGFDLLQGDFLAPPVHFSEWNTEYLSSIENLYINNKRKKLNDSDLISQQIIKLDTLNIDDDFKILFDKFHHFSEYSFFPVIDEHNIPVGIIHEKNIKKFVYSQYGKDLLINKSFNKNIMQYMSKCPIADIDTKQEKIIEIFANSHESEGIIITKNLKYFGFLSAKSLLNIINVKNIQYAREMNPLTKLSGNTMIEQYINDSLSDKDNIYYFIYFDFDNFKPFNDHFGFRQGDKAINFFADILKKRFSQSKKHFIGHIGGDDFFLGIKANNSEKDHVIETIKEINLQFSDGVKNMFSKEEILQNYYISKNRDGESRKFSLLCVSSAIIELKKNISNEKLHDIIGKELASLKKEAKTSCMKIAFISL